MALPFDDRFQQLTDNIYQCKYNDMVQHRIKNMKLQLLMADIYDVLDINNLPLILGIVADQENRAKKTVPVEYLRLVRNRRFFPPSLTIEIE